MASHRTELHRYATTTIPQNLVLENGGWNGKKQDGKTIQCTLKDAFGRRNYTLCTNIHAQIFIMICSNIYTVHSEKLKNIFLF
jgi:hypothetical protein